MSEMQVKGSFIENIKSFFAKKEVAFEEKTGVKPEVSEIKKELDKAATNENEQVEAQIDEPCAHEENLKKLESPAAKIFAGKLVGGGARVLHDFVEEKLPEVHEKSEEMYKKQQENKEKGVFGKMPIIELGKKIGEWIGGIFKK